MRKNSGVLVSVVCIIAGRSLWAQDWPQWRGPSRDGAVTVNQPKAWPEKLTAAWRAAPSVILLLGVFAGLYSGVFTVSFKLGYEILVSKITPTATL